MTLEEFRATGRRVECVSAALHAAGSMFDYDDPPGTRGWIYDDGIIIYACPTCEAFTIWFCDVFHGTLAECEAWIYDKMKAEGLLSPTDA